MEVELPLQAAAPRHALQQTMKGDSMPVNRKSAKS